MPEGFPDGASGKEPACQCRRHKRHGFNPWVGKIPRRRKGQPTAGFLPGESHGRRSLVGYSPWGCKESDTTEVTEHACLQPCQEVAKALVPRSPPHLRVVSFWPGILATTPEAASSTFQRVKWPACGPGPKRWDSNPAQWEEGTWPLTPSTPLKQSYKCTPEEDVMGRISEELPRARGGWLVCVDLCCPAW